MNTGFFRKQGFRVAAFALLAIVLVVAMNASPAGAAWPQPAESPPTRFEGYLKAIGPGKWLIGDITVVVDSQTIVVEKRGRAEVGAWVIVWGGWDDLGRMRAELILVDRPASRTGPTVQFSGMLGKMVENYWVIEQMLVEVTENTLVSGNPAVGALVWVVAEQQDDMLVAIAIEVIAQKSEALPVEFEGPIEAFGPDFWQVDGHRVDLDTLTPVVGEPALDKNAEVQATIAAGGQLTARLIRVVDPSAEAQLTALVAAIAGEVDGAETWEVVVFPEEPWADPKVGILHVNGNTLVDESRATARAGQWAEVRGVELALNEYQADVIRLERPVPVSLQGELSTAPAGAGSRGWWQIDGRPVWWANPRSASAAAAYADDIVSLAGMRLANGVIWATQVGRTQRPLR